MILKKKQALYDMASFMEATHLLCHTSGFMDKTMLPFAIKGQIYKIIEKENRNKKKKYFIKDCRNVRHSFPAPGHREWFIPIKIKEEDVKKERKKIFRSVFGLFPRGVSSSK